MLHALHLDVAAEVAPLTLLQLPHEVLVLVFCRLDARSLVRVAATCSGLYRDEPCQMTSVVEALRERAAALGHVSPVRRSSEATSWVAQLARLERRRDEARVHVAGSCGLSFFVAEGGKLMSCGRGAVYSDAEDSVGMLGLDELDGENLVVHTPTLMPSMAAICITSVACGSEFNSAVSVAGTVYTWGQGHNGRLGHGDTERSLLPRQVQALAAHRVLSVATGGGMADHCMVVTEEGEVFSWGRDEFGQCGHGSHMLDQPLPRRVRGLTGVRARSASVGRAHSLVVTERGALYAFGAGCFGQLGHGSTEDVHSPKMVGALSNVRAVATDEAVSFALSQDGTVFAWGCNGTGELGVGQGGRDEDLPQVIAALSGCIVCAIAAGGGAACAVTTAGELYTWGCGYCGQLGHGDTASQLVPMRVDALRDEWVVAVSLAEFRMIAVTRDGSVLGWGMRTGLGLPEAVTHMVNYTDERLNDNDEMCVCIISPHRYAQLSCVHRG